MGKKKKKKHSIPFNGVVAKLVPLKSPNEGLYWVSIEQTPMAHAALSKVTNGEKWKAMRLPKSEAEKMVDDINAEYRKNPDTHIN